METGGIKRNTHISITTEHYPQLLSALLVVFVVQVLELILLQQKYDLFTGGFLQAYSYLTWVSRGGFLLTGLWLDLVLIGSVSMFWFLASKRFNVGHLTSAYNFTFVCSSLFGTWLGIKFKVLSYFNDTLNFLIIKNLGGGSVMEALSYIANEAVIFCVGIFFLASVYIAGRYWVKRFCYITVEEVRLERDNIKRILLMSLVLLSTIALMVFITTSASMRYGLEKKTSYVLLSGLLDELTDLDRDGHGLFSFPIDPKGMDSTIYPGALDVPGNGIDEDGYGGDFIWSGEGSDPLATLAPIPGKHIVIIMLESARSDLLGKTWQDQSITPNITKIAETGTSIDYVYSHTGYTATSIKALFNRTLSSENDRILLADYLNRSGYSLSFISGQDESFGSMASATGMVNPEHYLFDARSALEDRVYASRDSGSLRLSEERVGRQFNVRASEIDWNKPQFFYINLQAAHFPYTHPGMPAITNTTPIRRSDIGKANLTPLQATYWNAVAVADQTVGNILEKLKQLGLEKDTLIVIVSDHGESLFEDGFLGHGHALNQAQTQIPLILSQAGIEVDRAIGQVDIAELLVRAATNRMENGFDLSGEYPQLQFVGSLNKPQFIGMVIKGDIRTILDLRTRKLYFSDLKRWVDYDKASQDPELQSRTDKLIELWEQARWKDYLSRAKPQIN